MVWSKFPCHLLDQKVPVGLLMMAQHMWGPFPQHLSSPACLLTNLESLLGTTGLVGQGFWCGTSSVCV